MYIDSVIYILNRFQYKSLQIQQRQLLVIRLLFVSPKVFKDKFKCAFYLSGSSNSSHKHVKFMKVNK